MLRLSDLRFVLQPLPALIAILICLCPPTPLSAQTDFKNDYQSDYAAIRWSTDISKDQVISGEQFHASVDLISDIKQIRSDAARILATLVNPLSLDLDAVVTWEVIARKDDGADEISLGTYRVRKPLPKLEVGSQLDFMNERIPADGALTFPDHAEFGRYILYLRFTMVEAKASILLTSLSRNITESTRDYLPPDAYEPGIRLGEIVLVAPPPHEITPPRVIAITPVNGAIDVPVDTLIEVTFNEPITPVSTEEALTFSPEVPGQIEWRNATLTFAPRENLSYNTLYKVTVGNVTDLSQTALNGSFTWEFTTESADSRWWIFWGILGGTVTAIVIGLAAIKLRRRKKFQYQ